MYKWVQMYDPHVIAMCVLFAILFLTVGTISADEEVFIDADEKAKEILLGHDWRCKWKDKNYSWNSERMYQKASLKKVTAKIRNEPCPDGYAKFRGSIKNGILSGRFSNYPAPCGSGSIVSSGALYKKADGNYYTKSSYVYGTSVEPNSWVGAERFPSLNTYGKTVCTATPK